MEETFAKVEELAAHVNEYVNNRMASVKLRIAEKSSKVFSLIIAITIVLMIFVFFIVFAGIALAYVFAKWTGELYWGFLMVAGIHLLLGVWVWVRKEKILRMFFMNAMLHQLFKEEKDED